MTPLALEYVKLHAQDVRNCPQAYKADVCADPEAHAARLVEGLAPAGLNEMLRWIKAEARLMKRMGL